MILQYNGSTYQYPTTGKSYDFPDFWIHKQGDDPRKLKTFGRLERLVNPVKGRRYRLHLKSGHVDGTTVADIVRHIIDNPQST